MLASCCCLSIADSLFLSIPSPESLFSFETLCLPGNLPLAYLHFRGCNWSMQHLSWLRWHCYLVKGAKWTTRRHSSSQRQVIYSNESKALRSRVLPRSYKFHLQQPIVSVASEKNGSQVKLQVENLMLKKSSSRSPNCTSWWHHFAGSCWSVKQKANRKFRVRMLFLSAKIIV